MALTTSPMRQGLQLLTTERTDGLQTVRRDGLKVPSADPDLEDEGAAWPVAEPATDAILQPPTPAIRPSPQVLQLQLQTSRELER